MAGRRLSPETTAAIGSLLSCVLSGLAAIGAPPSSVSVDAGLWRALEPLMIPSLVIGFLLTFAAMFVSLENARAGGGLCIAGSWSSWVGAAIGLGLERPGSLRGLLLLAAIWSIPTMIALDGAKRGTKGRQNAHAG